MESFKREAQGDGGTPSSREDSNEIPERGSAGDLLLQEEEEIEEPVPALVQENLEEEERMAEEKPAPHQQFLDERDASVAPRAPVLECRAVRELRL